MDKTMYNEEMKHLLKFQDAHAPRLFFGLEEDIRLAVLKDEVEYLKSKLEPHDTGHLHTTISTLTHRVKELEKS
jgi:hypothetical protein